jgi:hypothetical protein
MNHLMWLASLAGLMYRRDLWHRHVLLDSGPSRSQIGSTIHRNRAHGIYPSLRRQAYAYLGYLGDVFEFIPNFGQQERASGVLSVVSLYAGPLRIYIRPFRKANQSASNR